VPKKGTPQPISEIWLKPLNGRQLATIDPPARKAVVKWQIIGDALRIDPERRGVINVIFDWPNRRRAIIADQRFAAIG
jgi:hypothetical protein